MFRFFVEVDNHPQCPTDKYRVQKKGKKASLKGNICNFTNKNFAKPFFLSEAPF